MEKVLTISVAAYNAAGDLPRCLESMLQTEVADKLEIIVVNDGSKDNTSEVVQKYADQYPDIVKLVDKENGGHGSTINASIPLATGRYYKIVDSDDWVDQKGIEGLVRFLEHAEADLVMNPYFTMRPGHFDTPELRNVFMEPQVYEKERSIEEISGIQMEMHAITFKTDIVKKMGPVISEHCFYVDVEYVIFPLRYLKSYACLDFPVYCYLLGTATQSMNINNMIRRRDQHLHVAKRLVLHHQEYGDELCPAVQMLEEKRVRQLVLSQFYLYFAVDPKVSLPEAKAFDQWLKTTSLKVYDPAEGRGAFKVQLVRILHFHGYGRIVGAFQKWSKVKERFKH